MHPESLLFIVDELDELVILLEDLATFEGLTALIVVANAVLVGFATGSLLVGVGAGLIGLAIRSAVDASCRALRARAGNRQPAAPALP